MDTITAETVKAFFAVLLIAVLVNVGVILYDVNQSNDYEKEVAQYIQKAGGVDETVERKADTLGETYYHGMFYITPDSRPTVAKDTPVYSVPKNDNDYFMVAQRNGQMFKKTSDNLSDCPMMSQMKTSSGKPMTIDEGQIISIVKGRTIHIPQAYQTTTDGRKVETKYIEQDGKQIGKKKYNKTVDFVIVETPNGEGMINKDLVAYNNEAKHLYGTRINYWVHTRIPFIAFAKFHDNNVAINHKYMTQTISNYGRFSTN